MSAERCSHCGHATRLYSDKIIPRMAHSLAICKPGRALTTSFLNHRHRQRLKEEEKRAAVIKVQQYSHPRGLPDRRRALTAPLPPQPRSGPKQRDSSQSQSSFVTRLPLEIREIIYKEVLGNSVIHLDASDARFCHRLCPEPVDGRCGCRYLRRRGANTLIHPLSLLLSCRLIYSEAVNILYSTNSFSFLYSTNNTQNGIPIDDRPAKALIHLPSLLLPQRLQAIRSVSLFWILRWLPHYENAQDSYMWQMIKDPEAITEDWARVWKAIKAMRGLRELYVDLALDLHRRLYIAPEKTWLEAEVYILEHMKGVTVPLREFRLVLPYTGGAETLEVGGREWPIERVDEATAEWDTMLGWGVA